ncbi:hypothetical protein V492_08525 [Pseudogymnoascus sp. VKM F-4246]|nr:hypothetical protein V492_08525 [Pseudogymnoascus sp. VKM F-4246]
MLSRWSRGEATTLSGHNQEYDIEKNIYGNTQSSLTLPPLTHAGQRVPTHTETTLSPISPIHEGITPLSSVTGLSLSLQWPAGWQASKATPPDQEAKKPAQQKQKIRRTVVFKLWFNTYLGSVEDQAGCNVNFATCRRHPFGMRTIWRWTTWFFVVLGNTYNITLGEWRVDTTSLLRAQELCVLIPWLTLREVAVDVEIPSPKVAILRFERGMQQGLLGRISRTSIMEYHAFGIISEGRKSGHHYMICGVQGDFTKDLVINPPKTVWTREMKFAGVGHASAMFKRGIRICTGTGIGAALSTCIQSPDWFLIWIGSDQEKTFGPTITGLIHKHIEPERMILWDSKKQGGRPDAMKLLKATWDSFGAEVIFITSNMQGNDEMMRGCREAGLHAFGTLWDF